MNEDRIDNIDVNLVRPEGGRPTKYKEEYTELAYKFCLLGATDADLARNFDVDVRTINNWKNDHPEFFQSIKNGREVADAEIAEKLYHKAKGYEQDEIELKVVSVGNNQGSEVVKVPVTKKYAPDTIAQIFWLKNRQPERWRDKQEVKVTGDMVIEVKLEDEEE